MSTTYTNTGKIGSVVGLIVTTVAIKYAADHSDEIVEGAVKLVKTASRKLVDVKDEVFSKVSDKEPVYTMQWNGTEYRMKKIWINK